MSEFDTKTVRVSGASTPLPEQNTDATRIQVSPSAVESPTSEVLGDDATRTQSSPASTSPDRTLIPEVTGYEVIRELGRGGMGAVYEAHSKNLNRRVALKIVLGGAVAGSDAMRRFLAEAEALAALQHPNIVQVYDRGEYQGLPFFTMEFCPGQTLSQRVKSSPMRPHEAAELVEQLAHAVAAAHACGILHRDLKPDNVLFALDGTPKIADFGLAKRFDESGVDGPAAGVTVTGAVMGTPSYMAPEQARGETKNVGPAADIYALGAILYRLLIGRPPFQGANAADTIRQVIDDEPTNPRTLVANVPRDLATICLKCLAKEPARRFASAQELAAELRRFLNNEPILTRRVGQAERLFLWARRRPTAAAAWALTILALILGSAGGVAVWQWRAAESARDDAKAAQKQAEEANAGLEDQKRLAEEARHWAQQDRLRFESLAAKEREPLEKLAAQMRQEFEEARHKLQASFYPRQIDQAFRLWQAGDITAAREVLGGCAPTERGWEFGYVDQLVNGCKFQLPVQGGKIHRLVFSPNGKRVAVASSTGTFCFDFPSRAAGVRIPAWPRWIGFTPDNRRLAASADWGIGLYDAESGKETQIFKKLFPDPVDDGAFSPDGSRIVVTDWASDAVKVIEVEGGKQTLTLTGHKRNHRAVAWSPNGKWIATGDESGFRIWDAGSGKEACRVQAAVGYARALAFSPDSQQIACVDGNSPGIWEVPGGKLVAKGAGHGHWAHSVAFSADGKQVISGGHEPTVRSWDAQTGRALRTYNGLSRTLEQVMVHPGGRYIAAVDRAGNLALWDAMEDRGAKTFSNPRQSVIAGFDPKSEQLLIASPNMVRMIDLETGKQLAEHKLATPAWKSMMFELGPRGGRLSLLGDKDWTLVDLAAGLKTTTVPRPQGQFWHAAFTPDEKRVVISGTELSIHNAATGTKLVECRGHSGQMGPVAFDPDGKWIAAIDRDKKLISVRDAATGRETRSVPVGDTHGIVFSSDGKILAVAVVDVWSQRDEVILWDTQSWAELRRLPHITHFPTMMAFSPDGKRLATAGWGAPISIWDVQKGERLLSLPGHSFGVHSLTFSADGRWLVSAAGDSDVRLWDGGPSPGRFPEKKP